MFGLVFSGSLIDRRGYIQSDTPQPAAPSNGMAAYGATQSQSDMVGMPAAGPALPQRLLFCFCVTNPVTNQALLETFPGRPLKVSLGGRKREVKAVPSKGRGPLSGWCVPGRVV